MKRRKLLLDIRVLKNPIDTPKPYTIQLKMGETNLEEAETCAAHTRDAVNLILDLVESKYRMQAVNAGTSQKMIEAAPDLLAELQNIADAKPQEWDVDMRDQFRQWAQSRARAAIAKVTSQQEPTPATQQVAMPQPTIPPGPPDPPRPSRGRDVA